jgi:hypothetical protein
MLPVAYLSGQREALSTFGVKHAFDMEDFKETLLQQGIGDPAGVARQLQKGIFLHPQKGLFFKSLPKTLDTAMTQLSWPLMGTFLHARNSPDATTGELTGDFAGRAVGSLLGSSLGAVGQLGGSLLLGPVGRAVGKAVSDSRSSVVPET